MCASFPHDSKEKDGVLKGRGFKREWSKRKPKESEEQMAGGQLRELRKKQKEKIIIEKQTFKEKKFHNHIPVLQLFWYTSAEDF